MQDDKFIDRFFPKDKGLNNNIVNQSHISFIRKKIVIEPLLGYKQTNDQQQKINTSSLHSNRRNAHRKGTIDYKTSKKINPVVSYSEYTKNISSGTNDVQVKNNNNLFNEIIRISNKLNQNPLKSQGLWNGFQHVNEIEKPALNYRSQRLKNDYNDLDFINLIKKEKEINSIESQTLIKRPQFYLKNKIQRSVIGAINNVDSYQHGQKRSNKKKIEKVAINHNQLEDQQRKIKLKIRKQLQLQYLKPFSPPSNVSATQYIIFEPTFSHNNPLQTFNISSNVRLLKEIKEFRNYAKWKSRKQQRFPYSKKVMLSHNSKNMVEVASLTKIMTCILALDIIREYQIEPRNVKVYITNFEAKVGGTSAFIKQNEAYALEDLLYGLMLPSGNDASIAIAVFCGRILLTSGLKSKDKKKHKRIDCYRRFIEEMNKKAKELKMNKTNYANSHGLANINNKSCALDLAILCEYAMKNEKFCQVVDSQFYEAEVQVYHQKVQGIQELFLSEHPSRQKAMNEEKDNEIINEADLSENQDNEDQIDPEIGTFSTKIIKWQNTHKLVHSNRNEYIGIKTGITPSAGPCLASCIKLPNNRYLIIIVLGCDKLSSRFRDTETLKRWAIQRQQKYIQDRNISKQMTKLNLNIKNANSQT